MANIKGLVSISTIIACYHINGDLCGDSCKVSDINSIEFENFEKLTDDKKNEVIEAISKIKEFGIPDANKVKNECIVFKSTNVWQPNVLFIFLLKENIYKDHTDKKIKRCIKQIDGKNIFLIVGGIIPGSPNHSKPVPFPTDEYTISKVNGNGNKYKFEITIPGVGGNQTGTRIPYGRGDLNGMGSFGGMATGMSTRTGMSGGFPSMSRPGTNPSSSIRGTTTNTTTNNNINNDDDNINSLS